jgi:hypothetical protein
VDAAASSVALQPDGKIDVAGRSDWGGQTGDELSLARYSVTGGTPPPACIAPKTKGKSLTNARRLLKRAHCRTGAIRHSYSKVRKSHVISEKPGHGRRLRNGAKINLLVSKGRRPSHTH